MSRRQTAPFAIKHVWSAPPKPSRQKTFWLSSYHHKIDNPADELAFRIARRAEWRALATLEDLDFVNNAATYVEGLRRAAEHDPVRAKWLAELMRKITT